MQKSIAAICCGVLTLVTAGAAQAADLSPRMPVKALPMVAPIANWSGFYVGGHIGGAWGTDNVTNIVGTPLIGAGVSNSADASGFLGGGQVGLNYQVGAIVFGAQFDGSWTNYQSSSSVPLLLGFTANGTEKTDWFSTLTARVGYAWDSFLLYVKGGGAWTRVNYATNFTVGGVNIASTSATGTPSGWTIGVGGEYMFAPNWSAFVEYNYMDFGTARYNFTATIPGLGTATSPNDITDRVNVIKGGINYRLNWGGPVVARY